MDTLKNGYKIINNFISHTQLNAIQLDIENIEFPSKAGGIRNAEKKFNSIYKLAQSNLLSTHVQKHLTGEVHLVRAILFNKTKNNNWLVPWHQDKTIAVSKQFEKKGWGPWSIKGGVPHVQPPLQALNQMITFRIHLDDSHQQNGCLKILPNTQHLGILKQDSIQEYIKDRDATICECPAGSALIMRPHILHASSKASKPSQRRVLHLEYSSFKLPSGITWS